MHDDVGETLIVFTFFGIVSCGLEFGNVFICFFPKIYWLKRTNTDMNILGLALVEN